jgi:hypothetical protein
MEKAVVVAYSLTSKGSIPVGLHQQAGFVNTVETPGAAGTRWERPSATSPVCALKENP